VRKPLLLVAIVVIIAGILCVAAATYVRHDNESRVGRAKSLVHNLQQLQVGESNSKLAAAIAAEFGNAPPPANFGGRYPKENCAAAAPLESCAYILAMNDSPMQRLLLKHPSLPHFWVRDWWGYAEISIANGTVIHHSFWVWYRSSNDQWRGFAGSEGKALPKYERVQARISDSYSVEREDTSMSPDERGFGLQSSLTPAATAAERQRASHFDFACLAQSQGCGEICEVMPDAWRDFYDKRGHLDVETFGSAYLFCSKLPK